MSGNLIVPNVVDRVLTGDRMMDIFSKLTADRIVFVHGDITDILASVVIAQLLYLEARDPTGEIKMYINSPGGIVTAGLAIHDTMMVVKPPVVTICVGQASSMAALLLAAGVKGRRSALPSSRVMLHQPRGKHDGASGELMISAMETDRLRHLYAKLIGMHTARDERTVYDDIRDDMYLSAEDAKAYGIIDRIISWDEGKLRSTTPT